MYNLFGIYQQHNPYLYTVRLPARDVIFTKLPDELISMSEMAPERQRGAFLREMIEQTVEARRPRNVAELQQLIKAKDLCITEHELVDVIDRLKNKNGLNFKPPKQVASTHPPDITIFSENRWFFFILVAILFTLTATRIKETMYPLVVLRWISALVMVLYLPGFALLQALFSEREDLEEAERFALSFGLSISITLLVGLLLAVTPIGLKLIPIVTSLSLFTASMAIVATYRRYKEKVKRKDMEIGCRT